MSAKRRRFLFLVGVALASLASFVLVFSFVAYTGHVDDVSAGWIGGVVYTVLLFWVGIRQSRPYWRIPALWFVLSGLFTMHLVALIWILRIYPQWRMIWFAPVVILEAGLLGTIVNFLFENGKRSKP